MPATAPVHHYRLTINVLLADGQPDPHHCALELQQRSHSDWQQHVCQWKRGSTLHGDDYLAALLAWQLLDGLGARLHAGGPHPLAGLQPHIDALGAELSRLT